MMTIEEMIDVEKKFDVHGLDAFDEVAAKHGKEVALLLSVSYLRLLYALRGYSDEDKDKLVKEVLMEYTK